MGMRNRDFFFVFSVNVQGRHKDLTLRIVGISFEWKIV